MSISIHATSSVQSDFIRANFDVLDPIKGTISKDISGWKNCKVFILLTEYPTVRLNDIHKKFVTIFASAGKTGCMFIEGPAACALDARAFRRFDNFPSRFTLKAYPTLEGQDHPAHVDTFIEHENLKWKYAVAVDNYHESIDGYAQDLAELVADLTHKKGIKRENKSFYISQEGHKELNDLAKERDCNWSDFSEAEQLLSEFEEGLALGTVTNGYFNATEPPGSNIQLIDGVNFIFMEEGDVLGNVALLETLSANNFSIKVLAPTKETAALEKQVIRANILDEQSYVLTLFYGQPYNHERHECVIFEQHLNYFSGEIGDFIKQKKQSEPFVSLDKKFLVEMAENDEVLENSFRTMQITGIDYAAVARFQSKTFANSPLVVTVPADLVHDSSTFIESAKIARNKELESRSLQREQWKDEVMDQYFALVGVIPVFASNYEITGTMKVIDHEWVFELTSKASIVLDFKKGIFRNDVRDFFRKMIKSRLGQLKIPAGQTLQLTSRHPVEINGAEGEREKVNSFLTASYKAVAPESTKEVKITGDFEDLQIGEDGSIVLKASRDLLITIGEPSIVVPENAPKKRRVIE